MYNFVSLPHEKAFETILFSHIIQTMKKLLVLLASAAAMLVATTGCQNNVFLHMEDMDTPQSVYVWTTPAPEVDASAGTQAVTIYATSDWTAVSEESWITLDRNGGSKGPNEVLLSYDANNTGSQRQGVVKFTAGNYSETFTLTQAK